MNQITSAFSRDGLAPGGAVLHPRSYVELSTIVDGEDDPILTGIEPNHVVLHRGSHNKADVCRVTILGTGLPFHVRHIGGSDVALYLGTVDEALANDGPAAIKDEKHLRFFGIVTSFEEDRDARQVTLEAHDLSSLCRRPMYPVRKTLNSAGVIVDPTPRYSDSLRQAIERLLSILPELEGISNVSGLDAISGAGLPNLLEPPLILRDNSALRNANLSSLVTDPRAKNGPIHLKPDSTVWEAIEYLCALVGLHVKVELREIVVRTADEVFASRTTEVIDPYDNLGGTQPPAVTFIFGGENGNCYGPRFHKRPVHFRNGVKVVVFDPVARKTLEAVYPSDAEVRRTLVRKRSSATRAPLRKTKPRKVKPKTLAPPPRDVYELDPGHYTMDALEARAKAIWLERSRQEVDGTVASPIWTEEVLGLRNGDLITIQLEDDIAREIERLGSDDDASAMLQDRLGLEKPAADALVRAARKQSRDDWYCKEVIFEHPSEHLVTVHFLNLIEI
jgi:hypothetical protein